MDKLLNELIDNLKKTFGERLSSVFLYGSCAVEDCSRFFHDLNLIVIIENLKADDLKKSHSFVKKFAEKGKYLPIFMDKEEWFNSCDVYAIECADIQDRHKILYGEDLINTISVEKSNLRHQCEQETKSLLIRLRQTYLGHAQNKKAVREIIKVSSKTFVVIFRTILRLLDEKVPRTHYDVVKLFSEKIKTHGIDFDYDLFSKVLEFRTNSKAIQDKELDCTIEKLIDTTNSVLKYVDKIWKVNGKW